MTKLRSDSFAARLTPAQRDELFIELVGGMGLRDAARTVKEWAGRAPSVQAISTWLAGERIERRISAAKEVSLVAQANCPADYDEAARRALGQAKYLAALEDLSPSEVAQFDRNRIAEATLALATRKVDLEAARLHLDQEKFCRVVLKQLAELQALVSEPGLADDARLERVRQRLFGDGAGVPTLAQMDTRKGSK